MDYYINEKKNAIAPEFTDTGATTVQQEINDTFSSVAQDYFRNCGEFGKRSDRCESIRNIRWIVILQSVKILPQYQKVLKNFQGTTEQSHLL
ncbi:MAG: hypothetical protein ACLTS6_17615 [Anaerobutyricum sp.]